MARPQVLLYLIGNQIVKVFWKYFKEHVITVVYYQMQNLQDPTNKRMIICDDKLKELLGEDQIQSFGLMKYLKKYFIVAES